MTLNLSANTNGDSNDETNFPHKLLLTDIARNELKVLKGFIKLL